MIAAIDDGFVTLTVSTLNFFSSLATPFGAISLTFFPCLMKLLMRPATKGSVPADVGLKMLRLHAPEESGLSKNYIEA